MKTEASFPESTIRFLNALSRNNNREWFENNRARFDFEFLQPAMQLVTDIGEMLAAISPNINAVPRIDKSIFRLHRDVRFSKNKSPYKTNMGLYFWEGRGKKMECPGFYFHVEPKLFFLGTGMYWFPKEVLSKYRNVAADPEKGKELNEIILRLMKNEKFILGGKTFKKIPRDFDPEYKYSDLLLHSGLYIYYESRDFSELRNPDPVNVAFNFYRETHPLHRWLLKNIV